MTQWVRLLPMMPTSCVNAGLFPAAPIPIWLPRNTPEMAVDNVPASWAPVTNVQNQGVVQAPGFALT